MDTEPKVKMGAPKKRDQVVATIADSLGMVLAPEVLTVADMSAFPQLHEEDERDQLIMCANACGLSARFISRALGVYPSTVTRIINRIDPDGVFRISKEAKKAFITQLYESRITEALMSITPEKLEEASASELMRIAKSGSDVAQSMNQTKHRESNKDKLDMMLDRALKEMDKAEVEGVD